MKMLLFVYPIAPAIVFGMLLWFYWRKKGYSSPTQLVMNIILFYAAFYGIIRFIATW